MKRFSYNQSLLSRMNRFRAALCDEDFKAAARVDDDGKVELVLHGVVGDWWEEMDSLSVASFLARHKDNPVHVRMNSEGGLVFDGIAIYQALADHPQPVTGTIEALAASAMSVIRWLSAEQAIEKGFVDEVLPLKASDSGASNRADQVAAKAERLRKQKIAKAVAVRARAVAVDSRAI